MLVVPTVTADEPPEPFVRAEVASVEPPVDFIPPVGCVPPVAVAPLKDIMPPTLDANVSRPERPPQAADNRVDPTRNESKRRMVWSTSEEAVILACHVSLTDSRSGPIVFTGAKHPSWL